MVTGLMGSFILFGLRLGFAPPQGGVPAVVEFQLGEHEDAGAGLDGALDVGFDLVADGLNRGRAVSIVGFGKWEWRTQPAKDALDPRTGAPRRVPARRKVGFKPSERLKSDLNPGLDPP